MIRKIRELGFHKPGEKSPRVVYLMRGCPASGKSYAAKKLAGKRGVICETDSYFGFPGKFYDFHPENVNIARNRNMAGFKKALHQGISPIVVDRGNGKGKRTRWYVQTAFKAGYEVQFAEPTSVWWVEIKALLLQRGCIEIQLGAWATVLAEKQQKTHGVPAWRIRKSLDKFDTQLTVKKILEGANG